MVVTIAKVTIRVAGIRIMSAGNILRLIMEVVMAANRKRAPIRLQHKLNIIFSVLLVFIFGVLLCVLKIISSQPFFASLYHKSVNSSIISRPNHAVGVDIIKMLFATAKSYLTSSLFTITYYLPKAFSDGFSEE